MSPMRLFDSLSFSAKMALLPAVSAIAFLVLLVFNLIVGSQVENLLVDIQAGHFPALQLSRDLEFSLNEIQRGLQDAVASDDEELINEIDALRDGFLTRLSESTSITTLDPQEMAVLTEDFEAHTHHVLTQLAAQFDIPAQITTRKTCVDNRLQWSQAKPGGQVM